MADLCRESVPEGGGGLTERSIPKSLPLGVGGWGGGQYYVCTVRVLCVYCGLLSLTHQLAELSRRQRVEGIVGGSEESERPLLVQQLCHSRCLDGADQEAESRRGYV